MITIKLADFRSDSGRQLLSKIAAKHRFPTYVLVSQLDELTAVGAGNETKYAAYHPSPSLPHWCPATTWLSYAYFKEQSHHVPQPDRDKIASRLRDAGSYWGITGDLDLIDQREQELVEKTASAVEDFPLRNEAEVDAATKCLHHHIALPADRRWLSADLRIKLAARLLDAGVRDDTITRVSCTAGCYDAGRVAAKLASASGNKKLSSETAQVVQQVAKVTALLGPTEMQQQQAKLAVFADKLSLFDGPAELELSVNTVDPVVVLPNQAVVKKAVFLEIPDDLFGLCCKVAGMTVLARESADLDHLAYAMTPDVAAEFIEKMGELNLPCEVSGRSFSGSVIDSAKLLAAAEGRS